MFEFKMSYKDPDFHKPGDPPFVFPPKGVNSAFDGNLIEIEGSNGTGKTTLLNCLALAIGYGELERDLEQTKPMLARKLHKLEGNPTLSYSFTIRSEEPSSTEIKVERKEGQKRRCWLDSKAIDLDVLTRKLEVIFLTEDDPKKVVNASLGKLAGYFKTLDYKLNALQDRVTKNLMDIRDFHEFRKTEKEYFNTIKECEENIKNSKSESAKLNKKLEKIRIRDDIGRKIDLLGGKAHIVANYEDLKTKYEKLKKHGKPELNRKWKREAIKLEIQERNIRELDVRILQTCGSLKMYGVGIDGERLLKGDYSEYNKLKRQMSQMQEKAARTRIVDEMIELFQRHPEREMVPVVDKTIKDTLNDLFEIKKALGSDRTFGLISVLVGLMEQRNLEARSYEKISEKAAELRQQIDGIEELETVEEEFSEAQDKYMALQKALKEDKGELYDEWAELRLIKGDVESLGSTLRELELRAKSEERIKSSYEHKLKTLREGSAKEPDNLEKAKHLENLSEMITRLRESIFHWTRILEQPEAARKDFTSSKERPGFAVSDYKKFVNAVGEFLGNQFEPVAYNYKLHEIKFYDIENGSFVTEEERRISIDDLSKGQSKIATLRKIFKEMDPAKKKKVVLIDEIADLDPENMQFVKKTLKEKHSEGSVLLAILVRPPRALDAGLVEIRGW